MLIWIMLMPVGCAGPWSTAPTLPPRVKDVASCGWILWQMGIAYGEPWYKPLDPAQMEFVIAEPPIRLSAEACQAQVKTRTGRWRVGLIGWYPIAEGAKVHVGCLPDGYDPYEGK